MSSSNITMQSCLEFASNVVSNKKDQVEYAVALHNCRVDPAYRVKLKSGEMIPVSSYPLMSWDSKGWTTVRRKIRVKRVKTDEELDYEAELDNWEPVEHYGRGTYVDAGPALEHNGALFDIGSRF